MSMERMTGNIMYPYVLTFYLELKVVAKKLLPFL